VVGQFLLLNSDRSDFGKNFNQYSQVYSKIRSRVLSEWKAIFTYELFGCYFAKRFQRGLFLKLAFRVTMGRLDVCDWRFQSKILKNRYPIYNRKFFLIWRVNLAEILTITVTWSTVLVNSCQKRSQLLVSPLRRTIQ
jgi:hypothetical protein